MFTFVTTADFASPPPPIRWLVPGFLHPGHLTVFTSPAKSGKTTLLSVLLAKFDCHEPFLGQVLEPQRVVIVSEESAEVWHGRVQRLSISGDITWCLRPFLGLPTLDEWQALVDHLATLAADVVIIDPLAMVLPSGVECVASSMLAFLHPLHRLTAAGAAVLLVHHPRKSITPGSASPRGSGALTGFADIVATLDHPPGTPHRQRRLSFNSRLAGRSVHWIELITAGDDYVTVPAPAFADDDETGAKVLRMVFEDACERLPRGQVHAQWPADHDKPSLATLSRWLDQALADGWVLRKGLGRRNDPYLYWLKGKKNLLPDLPVLEPLVDIHRAVLVRKADQIAEDFQNDFARQRGKRARVEEEDV